MPLHRRLPKRGFNNIFASKYIEVNLDRIQKAIDAKLIEAGETSPQTRCEGGRAAPRGNGVRLLGAAS